MDRGVRDVINWWKGLREFPFFSVIVFFKCSNGGLGVVSFSGSKDRVGSMENSGVGDGIFIGGVRGGAIEALTHVHDKRVKVREEMRVLVKVAEAS